MCSPRRLIVMGMSSDSGRNPIGWRTQSDRVADAIRLGGGRKPIGWRTESDRVADGIRLDGERNPIGRRTESDWVAGAFKGVHLSQVHQQSYQVSNKAVKYPTKQSSVQQSYQVPNKTVKCTNFLSVVNILAWLVHLRQVHPLKKHRGIELI